MVHVAVVPCELQTSGSSKKRQARGQDNGLACSLPAVGRVEQPGCQPVQGEEVIEEKAPAETPAKAGDGGGKAEEGASQRAILQGAAERRRSSS